MVDRRPVRHRITAIRPRRGPRLRQCGRGPLGRRDLLHRLPVLHLGRVPDLPGSRGCRAAGAEPRAPAVLRLPAGADRLVGHGRATGRDLVLQRQHRHAMVADLSAQAAHQHVWRPDAVGSVCFLVASALAWFEACHGWAAWRPRSWSWWITLANLVGSVAFGVSAVAGYINPVTGQLRNAERSNLAPSSARCASSPARCCCCPNAPRTPARWSRRPCPAAPAIRHPGNRRAQARVLGLPCLEPPIRQWRGRRQEGTTRHQGQ